MKPMRATLSRLPWIMPQPMDPKSHSPKKSQLPM